MHDGIMHRQLRQVSSMHCISNHWPTSEMARGESRSFAYGVLLQRKVCLLLVPVPAVRHESACEVRRP